MFTKREKLVRQLLETIPTENPNREGLLNTPNRVARMYEEIFSGYEKHLLNIKCLHTDSR